MGRAKQAVQRVQVDAHGPVRRVRPVRPLRGMQLRQLAGEVESAGRIRLGA